MQEYVMEERIESLIVEMTLDEKISMLAGVDFWCTGAVERLGIPPLKMTDGPYGTRTMSTSGPTRLLPGTCYPVGVALASTWNTGIVNRVGEAIGDETREKGMTVLLGPCMNIQRSPLGGRNFESYSEDPYLSSRMVVAMFKGIQSRQVGACVKHYALNNSEYQRLTISSEVQERAMREIYLPSFETAVKEAGTWAVMSSYNKVNGAWASENSYLLNDILRAEWGFDGVVISDWGAVHSTVPAALAGLDIEMPGPPRFYGDSLLEAVKTGRVSEDVIDDKVRRVLKFMVRTGILDEDRVAAGGNYDRPEYRRLAREAADEAIILLKNSENILPLDKSSLKSIAIIGPNAAQARVTGGGSSQVKPYYTVSPLEGIRDLCGSSVKIVHEPGCFINRYTPAFDSDFFMTDGTENENGLTAHFFGSTDLTGEPFLIETDTELSSMWISPEDPLSCRWTGTFTALDSGVYKFGIITDDFARVYIGEKLVIDKDFTDSEFMSGKPAKEMTGEFDAGAGEIHPIVIDYRVNPQRRGMLRRFRLGCEPPVPLYLMERAVKAASDADIALVFVGTSDEWETEGFDREDMELPGRQAELVERVAAAGTRTVVVLNNGSPLEMYRWVDKVAAVVEAWFSGQECGSAIAGVLFGKTNPSGKLPVTLPVRLEDNPAFENYPGEFGKVHYGEDIFVGYRYYDNKLVEPQFPFGHGLSYTTFEYINCRVDPQVLIANQKLDVEVDIANTGNRPGKETVQLYIRDIESTVPRPPKELKGFDKVYLEPGETGTVRFTLDMRGLSFYDPESKNWVAEPGEFEVLVGSSSRDIRASALISYR
jgi:beta-glucosidase